MILALILVFVTLTCLRLALKTVREAWDLWDRYVARKGVPGEEAPPATFGASELGGGGRGAGEASAHEQLNLWP
jgi:hypothetical protein